MLFEMTKHERIISMFEIGRPSGQRCQVEGGTGLKAEMGNEGSSRSRSSAAAAGGGSDAPLLVLEPTSQKLTEIWRKNFKLKKQ